MNSPFLNEWIAGFGQSNYLPISTACNSDCIFCTNKYNIFPCRKGLFRDIEDIKLQLSLMKQHQSSINLSSILPGRLPEGEAFLHPDFFEILEIIRKKYPSNTLNIYTNGSTLSKNFLKKLSNYNPIKIVVSLHTTNAQKLAFLCNRPLSFVKKIIESIPWINNFKIELAGALLPFPKLLGWEDIEETIQYLLSNNAKELILHHPGYTKKTPKEIINIIDCDLDELTEFTCKLRKKCQAKVHIYPDMKASIEIPIKFKNALLLTSEAAYSRLKENGSNSHYFYAVKNNSFGGNVTVGGLLMVNDFIEAGKKALKKFPKTEIILLPSAPFDAFRRDLLYTPAQKIVDKLKKNTAIINNKGEIISLCQH